MPVLFKLKKCIRTFKDNRQDPCNNRWYARAFTLGTVETDEIAEIVQRNCSMKKSDVKAVIEEIIEVIKDKLQESYAVKLNGLGTFKIGIHCIGADTVQEFSVTDNIVGSRVNFQPAYTRDAATGLRTTKLLNGCRYAETRVNKVERK